MFNQCYASKKTTPPTNNACTHAYAPTRCMTFGEALHLFISARYKPLNSPSGFCSLQSLRGRLIVLSELLWFKVIERDRPSRETHEWFSSSLRPFSRSVCNVAPPSNCLSWLWEIFLSWKESRQLLFKVKIFYIIINIIAVKRNLLCRIFQLCKIKHVLLSIIIA